MKEFLKITYGSKLYGTSTPTSDTDEKVVYIPELNELLLCRTPGIFKRRFDAEGRQLNDNEKMADNGVETEYIPLQRFVRDFVAGQTYALEIAHGYMSNVDKMTVTDAENMTQAEYDEFISKVEFVDDLITLFSNSEVYSMVGFAAKQTFDYVKRGERLNEARKVMAVLSAIRLDVSLELAAPTSVQVPPEGSWQLESSKFKVSDIETSNPNPAQGPNKRLEIRLDTPYLGAAVLDAIALQTGLPIGEAVSNGNRKLRTLELNGRQYLETTTIDHVTSQVAKLIQQYGDRSTDAAEKDVDYKSLSHAVRVYEQAIELLDTRRIKFPRPNADFLLDIKQGSISLETVKELLSSLDAEVKEAITTSKLPARTPALEAEADKWMLEQLQKIYKTHRLNGE